MLDLIFYGLSFWLVVTSLIVVFATHPVVSVLSLISCFFNAAGLFLLLNAEYLAFSLMIVYIGAVAVLFLFVVMLIDVKKITFKETLKDYKKSFIGLFLILLIEILCIVFVHKVSLQQDDLSIFSISTLKTTTNTHALGDLLYSYHFLAFELSGIALLIAMIGAIVLVHEKNHRFKRQDIRKQLLRSKHNSLKIVKVEPVLKNEGA
ncbi:MAG: hypothetical protein HEEMFOPI_01326 [Holosporales bacterium]